MNKITFLKIIKNRNFLKLWISQILSQVTAYLLNFVLMIRIYQETGSSTALSLFLLVYTAPSIFLGLFAGAFIDLWSKRKIMLFSHLSQSLIVLFYLGTKNLIWPIYTIVCLYSVCDEFFHPAEAATLPSFIERDNLPVANSLFFMTSQGSILVGSILGSPVSKYLGLRAPFILASVFLLTAALLAYLLPRDQPKKNKPKNFEETAKTIISNIAVGYRFIKNQPRVLYPFWFYIFAQVLIMVCLALFPLLAHQVLLIDVRDTGLAVFLPIGLGAIFGINYVNHQIKIIGRKRLISLGWLVVGICFLVISLLVKFLPRPAIFSFLVLFFLGLGSVLIIITSLTMIQENTPEDIRGRVFGSLHALIIIGSYLPVFFLATIADIFGILTTLFIIGSLTLLIGLVSFKVDKKYVLGTSNWP